MLTDLRAIVPVPHSPIDIEESVLTKNVGALKVAFPQDFVAYGRLYGSGTISVRVYDWEIYSPFRLSYPKFVKTFFKRQDAYRQACETTDVPLGLFPESGGLLPFGHRDDVYFTWKTDGNPDDWKVVVIWLYEPEGYQAFDMTFSTFLVSLLRRKIQVAGFKSKWNPKVDISFQSEVFGD